MRKKLDREGRLALLRRLVYQAIIRDRREDIISHGAGIDFRDEAEEMMGCTLEELLCPGFVEEPDLEPSQAVYKRHGGRVAPTPEGLQGVEYALRYGGATREQMLRAASAVSWYKRLAEGKADQGDLLEVLREGGP